MDWKYTDPRFDINKRADIIILRPSPEGCGRRLAGEAHVDTKEVWCVFTPFEDHRVIDADETWDEMWCWTFAPPRKV